MDESEKMKEVNQDKKIYLEILIDGKEHVASVNFSRYDDYGHQGFGRVGFRTLINQVQLTDLKTKEEFFVAMEEELLNPKPRIPGLYLAEDLEFTSYGPAEGYLIDNIGLEKSLAVEVTDHIFRKWHSEGRDILIPVHLREKKEIPKEES